MEKPQVVKGLDAKRGEAGGWGAILPRLFWSQIAAQSIGGQMQNITVLNFDQPDMGTILDPEERLLWSGGPGYGHIFFQTVGEERTYLVSFLVAALIMWSTLPFIDAEIRFGRVEAVWIYGATTLALFAISLFLASQRQYVLGNLMYFVTNKRAVICLRGRNWRFRVCLYVVSCPHSETFPYAVIASRPYPMLRIGTLLSKNQVQPFGLGLSHPGHPFLWGRTTYPITFDYMPNAHALLDIIQTCIREQ